MRGMKFFILNLLLIPSVILAQNLPEYTKADSLFNAGDYTKSLELSRSCAKMHENNKEWSNLVDCKNLTASNLVRLGNLQEALIEAESSAKINQEKINNSKSAECLNTLGYINLVQGRNDKALENFENALKLLNKEDGKLTAQTYNNLALVYWNTGNTDHALNYHEKAYELRKKMFGANNSLVGASLNNIGLIYSSNSPEKALEYYNQALEIYKNVYGENHPKIAIACNNIAIIYRQQGKIKEALEMFDKVLAIWQENFGENHPNVAFTYSNIGQMYVANGGKEIALNYMQKALKIYIEKYGNKHPEIANTYNFIGNIYKNNGEFEDALKNYQMALIANLPQFEIKDFNSNPPLDGSYNTYTLLTSLLYKAQTFERIHLEKSLKFKDLKSALDNLELCDQLIENIRHTTINESDKIALGQISSEVYEDALRVSSMLAQTSLKWKEYNKKAFYFSEKNKSAVLLEAISESNAKQFANIPDELIQQETDLNTKIAYYDQKLAQGVENKKEEEEVKNILFQLKEEYQVFTKKLETEFPEYYNLKYNVSVASVEDVQKAIDDKTVVMSYFQAPRSGRLYIFRITKTKFDLFDMKRVDELDKNLTGLRNALEYNIFEIFARESNEVYRQLMPIKSSKKFTKMIIIPDGRLGAIPFESLTTQKRKKDIKSYSQLSYLINDVSISYDYSTTLFLQTKKKSDARTDNNSILLCAPVEFEKQVNLPGTESEVDQINTLFSSKGLTSSSFLHDKAQESLIKSNELKKYKFLHFATHGVVNESQPELSEIFLSPDKTATEDGNLFSGEIYNLDINADLVCLSACQTGLGKVSKGEGIIGLTRALLYAGSNNIIVSLWKVSDASTSELMVDFYNDLLSREVNQMDYATSLRESKLKLIKSEKFSSPFYWAPFILIGK